MAASIPTTVMVITSSISVNPLFLINGIFKPIDGNIIGLVMQTNGNKWQTKGHPMFRLLVDVFSGRRMTIF